LCRCKGNLLLLFLKKLNFDDNADWKHEELFKLRDETQEDQREVAARKFNLSYIGLDGNIGCIVNGAGLAMATMDIIKLYGGSPANFLDVGGGASQEQLAEALKILNSDPKVQAILVNIFGGIMRCDLVAHGIINAAKQTKLRVPLVVRLQGTNFKEAKQIMDASDMKVIPADDLEQAASKAVQMANIMQMATYFFLFITF
jgi:succinyl-CoA synthetase beta subunit